MSDRTVHGLTSDGRQIVRYDRSGKWWLEDSEGQRRVPTLLQDAVRAALDGQAFLGKPGGKQFDAGIRRG